MAVELTMAWRAGSDWTLRSPPPPAVNLKSWRLESPECHPRRVAAPISMWPRDLAKRHIDKAQGRDQAVDDGRQEGVKAAAAAIRRGDAASGVRRRRLRYLAPRLARARSHAEWHRSRRFRAREHFLEPDALDRSGIDGHDLRAAGPQAVGRRGRRSTTSASTGARTLRTGDRRASPSRSSRRSTERLGPPKRISEGRTGQFAEAFAWVRRHGLPVGNAGQFSRQGAASISTSSSSRVD